MLTSAFWLALLPMALLYMAAASLALLGAHGRNSVKLHHHKV